MNLDAIVWLVAGIGLGLGLSLILLLAYSALERARLHRRMRQHRQADVAIPAAPIASSPPRSAPTLGPAPTVPEAQLRDRPEALATASATPAASVETAPLASPKSPSGPVSTPAATDLETASEPAAKGPSEPADQVEIQPPLETPEPTVPEAPTKPEATPPVISQESPPPTDKPGPPTPQPAPAPAPAATPLAPRSVEAIFAEAFANDRYVKPGQHGPSRDEP